MKKLILLILLLIVTLIGYSQTKSIGDTYVEYFKSPRESVFIHTNKTTYLPGEDIWFKVYIQDRQNQLSSKATSNIHLALFDKDKNQLERKLLMSKDGFAYGNIEIDTTFASGDYYLKVWTNWMKNFKEDDSFVQQIKVVNPQSDEKTKPNSSKEYDIQFLPEGGHLLYDVKNIVGIKAIDDIGKGSNISGVIFDSSNNEVVSFNTNTFGLGRFSFTPQQGEQYKAKVTLNSTNEIELALPEAKEKGIAIEVGNLNLDNVVINLSTNQNSFEEISSKAYSLFIHKDGIFKKIPVQFSSSQLQIVIPKKELYKGINIVTLFDQNDNPILERMFFNASLIKEHKVNLQKTIGKYDSISYNLTAASSVPVLMNTSISVLPKGNISYNPKHNILSAFYLEPYLKGSIENPSYYFTDVTRKKRYELDLLLLTQGWSRYEWDAIFNNPPKLSYAFESGLTISGDTNDDLHKVAGMIMYPSIHHKSINLKYDEKGKFTIENLFLVEGEYLSFSAFTKRGKTKKPGLVINYPQPLRMRENIDISEFKQFTSYYNNANSSYKGFVTEGTDILEEIVVTATLDKQKRKKYNLKTTGKIYPVTRETDKRYLNVGQFLDSHGFAVNYANSGLLLSPGATNLGGTSTSSSSSSVAGITIKHLNPNKNPVVVFLDNVQLNEFTIVANRALQEFEDIYIDDTYNANLVSVNGGVSIFATVIKLFTRKEPMEINSSKSKVRQTTRVPFGFAPRKKFYAPKYVSYDNDLFRDVGTVDWKPNFKISSNNQSVFNILNTGAKEVTFYIEGMTSEGDLISQIIHANSQGE